MRKKKISNIQTFESTVKGLKKKKMDLGSLDSLSERSDIDDKAKSRKKKKKGKTPKKDSTPSGGGSRDVTPKMDTFSKAIKDSL